jgi:dsDNA-specific endonuclease/ATPase MutS2
LIQSETLELLEWPRLCQHLSTFAATKLGSIVARNLPIPETQAESEQLLAQTKEVYELESRLHPGLSFEGIQDIGDSLERAALQSILPGEELLAIATTLAGARNLRRVIDNQENIPVLNDLVSELRTYPELEQEIHRCIDERGQVTDRASQKMGEIRGELRKVRSQITQKLQNIIQAKSGAVQEQLITQRGDRFVIPVKAPQKDAIPGIVHDTSTSGATLYIEPNSVVPLGNQLRQIIRKEQTEAEAIRRTLTDTGGKTVTLKTLGLAAVMAKVGLFIPAREPVEMPWFRQILADIGDEQSLQQSLSTFSGHIRRISRILEALEPGENDFSPLAINYNYQSLVLLDEVGAGTDPAEGSALAIALLKYLANHTQLTMASTHFGELKALKYEDPRFENASVEFDETTLSPTYRLLWGIPGRSNALSIALRLGLKPEVVAEAKTQVGEATDEVNQVIAGLEAQRRSQETKAAEAQKLLRQAERLYKEVSDKAAALEAREKDLRASQEIAVQQAISQAKGEIAQVIRRLQQGTPNAQDAQQATANINQIAQKYEAAPPPKIQPGFMPKLGDRVRIPKLGQTAEVLTIPDVEGNFSVRFGLMKMTVQLQDIESLDGQKPEPVVKPKTTPSVIIPTSPVPAIRTSKNTVDLRGKRVADAEYILDKAISEAPGPLWIIHGHGTGKLKQGVHAFLQQHPRVTHYEPAEPADGGSGVTIAHI